MSKRTLVVAIATVLAQAGCSLMPDHILGEPPVAKTWPPALLQDPAAPEIAPGKTIADIVPQMAARAPVPPLTEGSWRQFFTEPPLQATIQTALEDNRELRLSLNRIEEARAQTDAANRALWPTLDAVAQRSAQHTPATVVTTGGNGSGGSVSGRTTQRYDINLATSYELDFWGRARSLDTAAQANFLASDYAHQAFRLALIGDVAYAWYTLENWQQREHVLGRFEAASKLSLDLVAQRRDVGLASDLDYTAAQAAYHAARSDHFNASRQRTFAENALRLLLGTDIAPELRPPAVDAGFSPAVPLFPRVTVDLPAEVILRRPDVRAAEERLRAARANIGAARAAFLPHISLTASAGTASSALNSLFESGTGAWAFLPVLKLPLFDAGRYQLELDLAKVREHEAVASYEQTIQRAFREIADALAARPYGWVVVSELYNAADRLGERYRLVDARYQAGVVNRLELLDAERDMLNGQLGGLTARLGIQNSAVATFKSIGGI